VAESGEPAYRARQLFQAVYADRVESVDSVTTLPVNFREALKNRGLDVGLPKIEKKFVSSDGTLRYLLSFADEQSVETVWMPEGDGGEAGDGSEAGERRLRIPRSVVGAELRFAFPVRSDALSIASLFDGTCWV